MPTYTSFDQKNISEEEAQEILNQETDCQVCGIIKEKLEDFLIVR